MSKTVAVTSSQGTPSAHPMRETSVSFGFGPQAQAKISAIPLRDPWVRRIGRRVVPPWLVSRPARAPSTKPCSIRDTKRASRQGEDSDGDPGMPWSAPHSEGSEAAGGDGALRGGAPGRARPAAEFRRLPVKKSFASVYLLPVSKLQKSRTRVFHERNRVNDLPKTMRAVWLTGHGGLEKLLLRRDIRVPHPNPREVLIRVAAAGVNNTDINTRTA